MDDALLGRAQGLTLLAGGCCCCTGRAALIAALRGRCDQRSRISARDRRLQRLVLETSGLADPGTILAAIQADPVLVSHIVVDDSVVVVDALHGLAQLQTEALGRRQISAADRLILSKVDAAEPAALALMRATLRGMNPAAVQSGAVRGAPVVLPDLPGCLSAAALPALTDEDTRGPIIPMRLVLGGDTDWAAFTVWLSALLYARGNDLVRVRGVVRTPAGRLLLQTVRKVVQSPEILPMLAQGRDDGTIVLLGRGFRAQDLQASLRGFVGLKAGL